MGKTKLYATMEDNLQDTIIRNKIRAKRRVRQTELGHWHSQEPELPPLNSLFRQIFWRIRRHWLALVFQANRYTLGAFRERTALKLGAVICLGYFLFFKDSAAWFSPISVTSETMLITPVETSLEISDKPIRGKSLNWDLSAPAQPPTPKPVPKKKPTGSRNDVSPMAAKQMRDDLAQKYIDRYAKTAIQEMHKYGIPASISLAQGLVESRYGTSTLAVRNNNHFGMKCFSKKCGNGHCTNFGDDHHKDFFRKFKTPWESWRTHSLMLANGRYARLKKYGKNYRQWANGLENLGYATDRSYAEKLIGVIERYQLQRYDRK